MVWTGPPLAYEIYWYFVIVCTRTSSGCANWVCPIHKINVKPVLSKFKGHSTFLDQIPSCSPHNAQHWTHIICYVLMSPSLFPGRTFPKTGQTVKVHYTGEKIRTQTFCDEASDQETLRARGIVLISEVSWEIVLISEVSWEILLISEVSWFQWL